MSGGKKSLISGRLDKPFSKADLPKLITIWALFGPGLVWAGLSQGSGELIWWPYMVTKYGYFFVSWLLAFSFFQLWYNQELGRYTVLTGESIFEGWHRVHHIFGWFMLIMAIMLFSWVGGYLGGAASALAAATHFPPGWSFADQGRFWSTLLIIILYIIMLLGPVAYRIVEVVESIAALASFFGMLIAIVVTPEALKVVGPYFAALVTPPKGLVPPNFDPADVGILITMIAYTGAGGIWNMAYSFWLRDANWGMAKHIGRVTSPITGEPEAIPSVGVAFEPTKENLETVKKWSLALWADNLFGVVLNMATIFLTSILSIGILRPLYLAHKITVPKGWQLVVVQGEWLARAFGEAGRVAMLILGFFFLFDTFITAGDFFSRIVASNTYTNLTGEVKSLGKTWIGLFIPVIILMLPFSYDPKLIAKNPALGYGSIAAGVIYSILITMIMAYSATRNWEYRKTYYAVTTLFYAMGLAQLFLKKPGPLIILTGVTNMFIMVIACWVLLYLNWFLLPKIHPSGTKIRPHWIHFIALAIISAVFTYTFIWYLTVKFGI